MLCPHIIQTQNGIGGAMVEDSQIYFMICKLLMVQMRTKRLYMVIQFKLKILTQITLTKNHMNGISDGSKW